MSQVGVLGSGGSGEEAVLTLTGNSGGAVSPDVNGNINVIGSGSVNIAGDAGTNTLTVTVSGSGLTWTDKSTNFAAAASNGYFVTGNAIATLPASPAQGDSIEFVVIGAVTLTVTANTGQIIRLGSSTSSSAGTAVNTASGDSITIVYRSTGTSWNTDSVIGNWTIA